MSRVTQIVSSLKRLVSSNPDKARSALDAVEKQVNQRTGGKYADQIRKGRSSVDSQLGIPSEGGRSQTISGESTSRPADAPQTPGGDPGALPGQGR